jgi:methionyl-tRNA formyltransferase
MDEGLDTGPVLARRSIPILPTDTGGSLHDRLSVLGRTILVEELPRFFKGELKPQPQDHAQHTLAPIIEKENGRLDWTKSAVELERRIRAFDPWPGTFTRLDGKHLKVLKAQVGPTPRSGTASPGSVVSSGSEGLVVATGDGLLVLLELQLEGRKRLSAAEFVAGQRTPIGHVLG